MNKFLVLGSVILFSVSTSFANDLIFDSMDDATEVKLAPAINTTTTTKSAPTATNVNTTYQTSTIKEQKFNSALVNLDDAQVELRQELAATTSKYNEAKIEKERAIANCKAIKKEIREINKKMKNVEKSKAMINKNLEASK